MNHGNNRGPGEPDRAMERGKAAPRSWWRRIFNMLLCLVILGAGIAGASYLNKTAPKAMRKKPPRMDPLVRVESVQRTTEHAIVRAMGTVIPAMEMVLKPRVSGEVISTHPEFTEGGYLRKGTKVLQIDPRDYELAVAQRQSRVANAKYALKLELGHQEVAQREWELLKGNKPVKPADLELALRKPHLAKVRADLAAAEAELEQAKLDLDRTAVRVPFNAIVRSTKVEVGSQVSPQEALAELVGADEYWIQASIPVDRLKWIRIPRRAGDSGSEARVIYGNGADGTSERTGRVFKLLGDLAEDGRMARVLVSVKDPLDISAKKSNYSPLLIGEYVRVEIRGLEIKDVFKIPRTALRDNSKIWIAGDDDTLQIRSVEVAWRGPEFVLVRDGLKDQERLILSDLATPVAGMGIRIGPPGGGPPGARGPRGSGPPGGGHQMKNFQKEKFKERENRPEKTG